MENQTKSPTRHKAFLILIAMPATALAAYVAVTRLPPETLAFILGLLAGILASLPLNCLVVAIIDRKWSKRVTQAVDAALATARQARAPAEPRPFVFVHPPVQQAAPGTVRTVVEPLPRERHFRFVGRDGNAPD